MKVLCIGAHVDDIELSSGGYISKLIEEGNEVVGYVASLHSERLGHLFEELKQSWINLGVKILPHTKADFDSRSIDRQELLDTLLRIKDIISPDLVITHGSSDIHQSHRVCYEESLRAFKDKTILGYSFPWNEVNGVKNNYFVSLTDKQVAKKLISLKEYQSQKDRAYFNGDYQLNLMKNNGVIAGCEYAEAFEVIRMFK